MHAVVMRMGKHWSADPWEIMLFLKVVDIRRLYFVFLGVGCLPRGEHDGGQNRLFHRNPEVLLCELVEAG